MRKELGMEEVKEPKSLAKEKVKIQLPPQVEYSSESPLSGSLSSGSSEQEIPSRDRIQSKKPKNVENVNFKMMMNKQKQNNQAKSR